MKAKNETTEVKNNYDTIAEWMADNGCTWIAEWMADNGCTWPDMDKDLSTEFKRNKKLEQLKIE